MTTVEASSSQPAGQRFAAGAETATDWLEAMRRGDFESAWRATDRIEEPRRALEAAGMFAHAPHYLLWNGAPFDDRDVVVRCNHGLGDTLQFMRFVPSIVRRAHSVNMLVQPPLVNLLSGVPGLGHVRNGWAEHPLPANAVEIEVMELAYASRAATETLPSAHWLPLDRMRMRLPTLARHLHGNRKRVGLIWTPSDWDTSRGIPLHELEPLQMVRHAEFFSLQQGRAASTWREAPFPLRPLSAYTQDIVDAAAAMLALDLVITVDGMAAHLAGTLGRPVWALLKHDADWRWMRDRHDSPWYPTMRLFRQAEPDDWRSVAHALATALDEALI